MISLLDNFLTDLQKDFWRAEAGLNPLLVVDVKRALLDARFGLIFIQKTATELLKMFITSPVV